MLDPDGAGRVQAFSFILSPVLVIAVLDLVCGYPICRIVFQGNISSFSPSFIVLQYLYALMESARIAAVRYCGSINE